MKKIKLLFACLAITSLFIMGCKTGSGEEAPETPVTPSTPDKSKSFSDAHEVGGLKIVMGKCEVTREWYKEITKADDPSAAYPCTASEGDKRPVDNIDKAKAVDFCNKLSAKEDLVPYYKNDGSVNDAEGAEYGYRLPTKAEWEAFAWAGTESIFAGTDGKEGYYKTHAKAETNKTDIKQWILEDDGSISETTTSQAAANFGDPELAKYAWYKFNIRTGELEDLSKAPQPRAVYKAAAWELYQTNEGYWFKQNTWGEPAIRGGSDDSIWGTHAVARKNPNAWDLYDMTGNVSELVAEDTYVGGDAACNSGKLYIGHKTYETKIKGFRVCRTVKE